jgi:UDP-N-acetylglucosamine transferase subunit ALG13
VILGVVGTHEAPMDRLVRTLDGWAAAHPDQRVVIQAGSAATRVKSATAVGYASGEQMKSWMEEAGIVVTHAGPSTLLPLIDRGRRPIVMPRERRYREHVDDHQVAFAQFLAARGLIVLVRTPSELLGALDHPEPARTDATPLPAVDLPAAVERFGELVRSLF